MLQNQSLIVTLSGHISVIQPAACTLYPTYYFSVKHLYEIVRWMGLVTVTFKFSYGGSSTGNQKWYWLLALS